MSVIVNNRVRVTISLQEPEAVFGMLAEDISTASGRIGELIIDGIKDGRIPVGDLKIEAQVRAAEIVADDVDQSGETFLRTKYGHAEDAPLPLLLAQFSAPAVDIEDAEEVTTDTTAVEEPVNEAGDSPAPEDQDLGWLEAGAEADESDVFGEQEDPDADEVLPVDDEGAGISEPVPAPAPVVVEEPAGPTQEELLRSHIVQALSLIDNRTDLIAAVSTFSQSIAVAARTGRRSTSRINKQVASLLARTNEEGLISFLNALEEGLGLGSLTTPDPSTTTADNGFVEINYGDCAPCP